MSTDNKHSTPDSFSSLVRAGGSTEQLMEHLNKRIVPVPGFKPPAVDQANLYCPLPASCSQEDSNEFRSAGTFLQALSMEAKAWAQSLPENYRPAIIAVLQGGIQVEVRNLTQVSFDGIRIEGTLSDSPCSLLCHQSNVQMICHAIKTDTEQEFPDKNPIGFIWPDHNIEV